MIRSQARHLQPAPTYHFEWRADDGYTTSFNRFEVKTLDEQKIRNLKVSLGVLVQDLRVTRTATEEI